MKVHSSVLKDISYWSIFILSSVAFATSFAHASSDMTLELIKQNPEIADTSVLVKVGYLPKF